jgi:hypothetical protein
MLESTQFVLGPAVAGFEARFAEYVTSQRALGVNSGTSALHLALLAAGVGRGDEVITTPMTFIATVSAIDYCGATPVFVDIDPETLTMDPAAIEARITDRTKAILPVHLHGLSADLDPMVESPTDDLILIEDGPGARRRYRRRVGSIGISCFSSYPGRLGAYGQGGPSPPTTPSTPTSSRCCATGAQASLPPPAQGTLPAEGCKAVLGVKMDHRALDGGSSRTPARRPRAPGTRPDGARRPAARYHVPPSVTPPRRAAGFLGERGIATASRTIPVHLQVAFAEQATVVVTSPRGGRRRGASLPMFPDESNNKTRWSRRVAEWATTRERVMGSGIESFDKVFVTGGAGLIGSHIVDQLVAGRKRVVTARSWCTTT